MFINLNRFKTSSISKAISSLFLDFTATDTLDERVTFNRTSNATVTRSDGTIGFAPHNLVTFSEQFDNAAWVKTNANITANNAVAPNGTFTADRIQSTTSSSFTVQAFTAIDGTYTFSVYLRRLVGTTSIAISAGGLFNTRTINSQWARYEITQTLTAGSVSAGLRLSSNISQVEMWGAQLEISPSATTYNPTTVKNLLGFTELFDNAAWTKSNSFIQTNLLTFSEAFDNTSGWIVANQTLPFGSGSVANAALAPNGYQTADKVTVSNISGTHNVSRASSIPISASSVYTYSIYVKNAGVPYLGLWIFDQSGNVGRCTASIQTVSGVVTSQSGTVITGVSATSTPIGEDWYRLEVRFSTAISSTTISIVHWLENTTSVATVWTGDGTSGIFLWGAQLVQGSVAGDYRRTDATVLPIYYPNQDGVVVAEKLVENTATNVHEVNLSGITASVVNTFTVSCYVKKAERDFARLALSDQSTGICYAIFNLTDGTSATTTGGTWTNLVASSANVGNGWFRISLTATKNSSTSILAFFGVALAINNFFYAGNGTSGIYIFGAQLSDSASLDPYVLNAGAAPAAQAYFGARFDYDPVTLQPKGLLIEEQRTNLVLNSSLAGTDLATQNVTVTAVAHTLSFYGTGTVVLSGTAIATVTGTGAYPTRTTLTFTPTAGALTLTVTGTVQFAQLEAGAFATSYIPTQASQVTRATDNATIVGSNFASFYNQNEGSVFVNADTYRLSYSATIVFWSGSSLNNRMDFSVPFSVDSPARITVNYNGITQADIILSGSPQINTFIKASVAYKTNDVVVTSNNGAVGTDTLAEVPLVSQLNIGSRDAINTFQNGHIKQISYYNRRLSNSELQALTS